MEWNYIEEGINALVIDNFYSEQQLKEVWKELDWITKPAVMMDQKDLSSAEVNGKFQTSKRGVFLEEVFQNWRHSALISHTISNMSQELFQDTILNYNPLYKILYGCNYRTHLLSYYEDSDYYKPHTDAAVFTILSYFCKEPKSFTGGEVILSSTKGDKNATVEIKNNRIVVIASNTLHAVNPIVSATKNTLSGNGRYCLAAFLNVKDEREFKK